MKIVYVSGDDYVALEFENYIQKTFNGSVSDCIRAYENGERDVEAWSYASLYEWPEVPVPFLRFVKDQLLDYDDSKHYNIYYEGEII